MKKRGLEKDRYLKLYITTGVICAFFIVAVVSILVFGNLFEKDEGGKVISSVSVRQPDSESNSENNNQTVSETVSSLGEFKEISVKSEDAGNGSLIFVKNDIDSTAPTAEQISLARIYSTIPNEIYTLSTTKLLLEEEALNNLNEMMKGFYSASGLKTLSIDYAHTTVQTLKKNDMFEKYADLASGRSVRIMVYPKQDEGMGEGTYLWFEEHCHEYGFILRYPSSKEEITGVNASSTLYRYVGIAHANYMRENNLCLEEYLEHIKKYTYEKPLSVKTAAGEDYVLYYQKADENTSTAVSVPAEHEYEISGNNTDGFVITVKISSGE